MKRRRGGGGEGKVEAELTVLARGEDRLGELKVGRVGGSDEYGVDLRVIEDLVNRGDDLRSGEEVSSVGLCLGRLSLEDGVQGEVLGQRQNERDVEDAVESEER